MNVKKAIWERHNLGVNCTEYLIDSLDSISDISKEIKDDKTQYQVAKVESGNVDIIRFLEQQGFVFAETNIQLEARIESKPMVPAMFNRLMKDVSIGRASAFDTQVILEKIESGRIFTTDKVALDPHFGPKKAGRRYSLWSQSLLAKGGYFVVAKRNSEIISFSLGIEKEGYYDAFLGGLLDEKFRSFGFLPIYCNMLSAYESGFKLIRTGVSSNNLPILKLHITYGFSITHLYYVFTKHLGSGC